MNRTEYMRILQEALKDIPADERMNAISYYNDYIDAAGTDNEEATIEALGSPEDLAKTIRLASNDVDIVEGEFTETGYKNGTENEPDVPDKFTQVAKYEGDPKDGAEKKYNVFGVTITRSVLLILIIAALLIIPIFGKIGKGIFRTIAKIPQAITSVFYGFADSDKAAGKSGDIKTDGEKMVIGDSKGIKDIDMEAGAVSITVKKSTDGSISAQCDDTVKLTAKIDGDDLKISAKRKDNKVTNTKADVVLYLPDEMSFEDADIDVAAGELNFETAIKCEDLEVEVGAGEVKFSDVTANKAQLNVGAGKMDFTTFVVSDAKIDVGMGDFTMKGDIEDKLDLDVSMGNASLKLNSKQNDHDLDLELGMGSLKVGDIEMSGVSGEKQIDNDSSSEYKIKVGMGNATIKFD